MKSLNSICRNTNFVRSLEVACKALQYRKVSCITMIESFDSDDPLDDDLIHMYKEMISELEDAYDELFQFYALLCGRL